MTLTVATTLLNGKQKMTRIKYATLLFCLAKFLPQRIQVHSFRSPQILRRRAPNISCQYHHERLQTDALSDEADAITAMKNAQTSEYLYQILTKHSTAIRLTNDCLDESNKEQHHWQSIAKTTDLNIAPNIAAAALNKLAVIMSSKNFTHYNPKMDIIALQLLPSLITNVEQSMDTTPTHQSLSLYGLSGTLIALARLSRHSHLPQSYQPLARNIVTHLEAQLPEVTLADKDTTTMLAPSRLVGIVDAMIALDVVSVEVLQGIVTRLSKPGTFGRLSSSDLVRLLTSLRDYQDPLIAMVLRRLKKQTVHSTLTAIEMTLVLRTAVHLRQTECSSDANAMAYTLVKRGLTRSRGEHNQTLIPQFTGRHVATVLHAMEKFQLKNCDDVVNCLCHRLGHNEALQHMTGDDLAILLSNMRQLHLDQYPKAIACIGRRFVELVQNDPVSLENQAVNSILQSVIYLHETNKIVMDTFLHGVIYLIQDENFLSQTTEVDLATIVWYMAKAGNTEHPEHMIRIGERLRRRALETHDFSPRSLSMVLRFVVVKFGYNNRVMEPFLKTAKYLILAESILTRSDEQVLRDFTWVAVRAKWNDEMVILALAKRALQPDLFDDYSSSAACSLLSSFTTLASRLNSDRYDLLLSQVFNALGTHLLSNDLNQRETADALYAYAKTCYIYDMGIFDHLAALLSKQIDMCTVRDLAKSLWACGKMYAFEAEHTETKRVEAPPYLTCARGLAIRLVQRSDELLPKDVAQSMCAIGSMTIKDENIIGPLAQRAKHVASSSNSQEIANMLWGLSKVGYADVEVVRVLSARIRSPDLLPTTQEAANILYALGKLQVDDEATFNMLGQLLIDQVETCTAQAIANALWAFQELGLAPPDQLLQRWTTEKLGLIGLVNPTILHEMDNGIDPSLLVMLDKDQDDYDNDDDGDDDVFDGIILAHSFNKNK